MIVENGNGKFSGKREGFGVKIGDKKRGEVTFLTM